MSRLALVLMVLACMGGGEGWAGSVGVPSQASVTVPPIGRITLPGAGLSGREVTIGVKLAGVGEARGQWAELGEPVPVLVHSNVPWRVRVWVSDPQWAGAVAVRVGGARTGGGRRRDRADMWGAWCPCDGGPFPG